MKSKILLLLCPFVLMADGGYDIVPRTINFIVFAAILYYFIANHIKNAYKGRIAGIAARLDSIEQKLKDSKAKKDDALRRVEEAKANAASLVETARKEAILISERIKEETRQEVANLEKSFQDQKESQATALKWIKASLSISCLKGSANERTYRKEIRKSPS